MLIERKKTLWQQFWSKTSDVESMCRDEIENELIESLSNADECIQSFNHWKVFHGNEEKFIGQVAQASSTMGIGFNVHHHALVRCVNDSLAYSNVQLYIGTRHCRAEKTMNDGTMSSNEEPQEKDKSQQVGLFMSIWRVTLWKCFLLSLRRLFRMDWKNEHRSIAFLRTVDQMLTILVHGVSYLKQGNVPRWSCGFCSRFSLSLWSRITFHLASFHFCQGALRSMSAKGDTSSAVKISRISMWTTYAFEPGTFSSSASCRLIELVTLHSRFSPCTTLRYSSSEGEQHVLFCHRWVSSASVDCSESRHRPLSMRERERDPRRQHAFSVTTSRSTTSSLECISWHVDK